MKKIFLSFAALALVAVGTVSCGGDDSSPVKPTTDTPTTDTPTTDNPSTDTPTPGASGKFTYDGSEYQLDNQYFLLHGNDAGSPLVVNAGTVDAPEYVSYWIGVAYNTEDVATAPHYYQFTFTMPVEQSGEGFTILFPNEVEDITPLGIYAELDLEPLDLTGVNAAGITFNSFVYTESEMTTNNASVFGVGESALISHQFNGEFLGISVRPLLDAAAKGSKVNYRMAAPKNLKSVNEIKNLKVQLAK
ncbi:hypothetical protein QW060_19950 [Myroides ceti]|uniref:Lipoprotein n=1 Tax=Paenimyroides ceti TaxID=395087 RepID=A0ABT8CVZ5_9FLAO|nr:hypothetical protein [Paenimyroides ceti]MDN3708281.1 hypothetical protein [Paenimyroides ceti]MDN3709295.1 hypothetical protein [Paenimyroides ceti]